MTLVQREWAAQVGLLVYFPVLVLIGDRINGERLERWLEGWCNDAVRGRKSSLCRKLYGRINAKVTTAAAILNMANVRMIKIASCLRMFGKIHSAPAGVPPANKLSVSSNARTSTKAGRVVAAGAVWPRQGGDERLKTSMPGLGQGCRSATTQAKSLLLVIARHLHLRPVRPVSTYASAANRRLSRLLSRALQLRPAPGTGLESPETRH